MNPKNEKITQQKNRLCPMCEKPLEALSDNQFILKCDSCNITFAVGEIIEQNERKFCVFATQCVIHDPFTEKRRTRIFCKKYKEFNSIVFCKMSCEYRTPKVVCENKNNPKAFSTK